MDAEDMGPKGRFNERYDILTRKVVRSLSQDSRLSVTDVSAATGSYRRKIKERMARAEKELGIRYTIEFNESALGLNNPHIVLVKLAPKSDIGEIASVLGSSCVPQMVALASGQYDLVIYANALSSAEYVHWDKTTQVKLSKYIDLWEPSDIAHRQLGFFPIRNELLGKLKLPEEHMQLLMELNKNSRLPAGKLARSLGLPQSTLAYRLRGIMDEGYIKRFTLVMDKLGGVSSVGFFGKYAIKEGFETDASRQRQSFFADDRFPISNRYIFVSQLVGSYDFFAIGVFDSFNAAYREGVLNYRKNMKRHLVRLRNAEIKKVILGSITIRSLDVEREYNTIKWV